MITTFDGDLSDIVMYTYYDIVEPLGVGSSDNYNISGSRVRKESCYCKLFIPGFNWNTEIEPIIVGKNKVWAYGLDCESCNDRVYKYYYYSVTK